MSYPTAPSDVVARRGARSERAALLAVGLTTMLAPLNSTMIAVALPHVLGEFHASVGASAWLVTSYLAVMAVAQPVAGSLGDRLGRRRLVLAGLAWFGAASLGAAVAGSLPLLVACRLQQALAGALALPNGAALVREVLPARRRAAGFGFVGALTGIAAAVGPPLGGVLVGATGWRSMFLANVPLVAASLLLTWRAIPPAPVATRRSRAAEAAQRGRARFAGTGWLPDLLDRRAFAAAAASVALSNLAFYVMLLAVPLALTTAPGWTSAQVGASLAALSLATVVCSPAGGALADRIGQRWSATGGLFLFTAGAALLVAWVSAGGATPPLLLIGSLALAGAGNGFSGAAMQTAAIEAAGAQHTGAAAGLYSTSRYVGSIAGSAALAWLLGSVAAPHAADFHLVFVGVLVAAFLATLAALGLREHSTPSQTTDAIDTLPAPQAAPV